MRSHIAAWSIVVCVYTILVLPVMALAQEEAVVSGRVTDTTGGVLPGVTVRAVHEATGNAFEAVTDQIGAYRMPVRVGALRVTAELQGFTARPSTVELLLGQAAVVNLQMSPAGVAETLTVTGEAPLIETTTSTLGGNVDPRQVAELPTYGRIAPPQNRTDLRLQQRIVLPGRVSIDGIVEVFNMFNRPNWTVGTQESTFAQFLQHTNAQYRQAQVGFRLTF